MPQHNSIMLARFAKDSDGAIAILFALVLTVLCLAAGLAVDYGRSVHLKSNLQNAVDIAALAAASAPPGSTDTERKAIAQAAFEENAADIAWLNIEPTVTIAADRASVAADTTLPTTLMQVANIKQQDLQVSATAEFGQTPSDVYVVMDMSASLGIAADQTERERLKALTKAWIETTGSSFMSSHPNGCEFACHRQAGFEPGYETTYEAAKAAGIRLREDVLLDAAGTLLNTVLDPTLPGVMSGKLRAGIIGFSNAATWMTKPTSSLSNATASLATYPVNGHEDTLVDVAFPWINSQTLSESQNKKRTLVLVTDGVTGGQSVDYIWSPIDQSVCNILKQGGTELYVLEVKYEDLAGEPIFDTMVSAFYDQISPALETCASPGKYFSARTTPDIEDAFSKIANDIVETRVRLIN